MITFDLKSLSKMNPIIHKFFLTDILTDRPTQLENSLYQKFYVSTSKFHSKIHFPIILFPLWKPNGFSACCNESRRVFLKLATTRTKYLDLIKMNRVFHYCLI